MNSKKFDKLFICRTGNFYGIAATEYLVSFPNGDITTIWSPVWNNYDDDEEDLHALEFAEECWKDKQDGYDAYVLYGHWEKPEGSL